MLLFIILIASAELHSCFTVPPDSASISNQCDITRNPGSPLPSFARTEFMFLLHESRAMVKNVCLQLQIAPLIIVLVGFFFHHWKYQKKIFKHNYFYCGRLLEANFSSSAGLLNLSQFCCHIVWKDPLKPPAETNCWIDYHTHYDQRCFFFSAQMLQINQKYSKVFVLWQNFVFLLTKKTHKRWNSHISQVFWDGLLYSALSHSGCQVTFFKYSSVILLCKRAGAGWD